MIRILPLSESWMIKQPDSCTIAWTFDIIDTMLRPFEQQWTMYQLKVLFRIPWPGISWWVCMLVYIAHDNCLRIVDDCLAISIGSFIVSGHFVVVSSEPASVSACRDWHVQPGQSCIEDVLRHVANWLVIIRRLSVSVSQGLWPYFQGSQYHDEQKRYSA